MPDNAVSIYWDILDQKRQEILPLFTAFKEEFYLAGGTALALEMGHRDSIDFDFFSSNPFDTDELFRKIEHVFRDHKLTKTQEERNTLTVLIDDSIKLSFFSYPYELVAPLMETPYFRIASLEDIGPMKLAAITSRSVLKDYIDLYFILQHLKLSQLLQLVERKMPTIDTNLILKSLVYYEDIEPEPIIFKHDHEVDFEAVKRFLAAVVKDYLKDGRF